MLQGTLESNSIDFAKWNTDSIQNCNDIAYLLKGRGGKRCSALAEGNLCFPSMGFRLHKSERDLWGSYLAQVPWKVKISQVKMGGKQLNWLFFSDYIAPSV